jgi:hypothetical protein
MSAFDIVCRLDTDDIMAYRTLPREVNLAQVVRLAGADATFVVPSFLLPHHEHLLPPYTTEKEKAKLAGEIKEADGKPKTVTKEHELEQATKDEANVKISVHGRLPAVFDQELLSFLAALVKATKVVELEKEPRAMDEEVGGLGDFTSSLSRGMRDGMKRAVVDGVVNDGWIAKVVGKLTTKLETIQGELGYSGNIPVALGPYRLPPGSPEASKLLA